ncbi:MAG: tetraacyldisaccharide 4'-kinase [Caulobacterales bacterium]|jgi:tetraacyldisaccharide 4'-kinase
MSRAILSPIAWVWARVTADRIARATPTQCGIPVVCVGNLSMGGAGKTPVTRAVRLALGGAGAGVFTLSRGYGGREKGPRAVKPDDAFSAVGDEPLLHARDGPAWIARDRLAGAQAMIAAGARAIVMDDGFQNMALAKALSILVFDASAGIGNGKTFPVGPLREPLSQGLPRADAVVMVRPSETADRARPDYLHGFAGPILEAWLGPITPPPPGPLLAFAGIARPQKFFDTLEAAGGELVDGASYPDHHPFTPSEMTALADHAQALNARLITTEKDAVRLPPSWREKVAVLPVVARLADPAALQTLLAPIAARLRT